MENKTQTILHTDKEGVQTIERNGIRLICPFRNAIAIPGRMAGQIQFMQESCSNKCPHFIHHYNPMHTVVSKHSIKLQCGNGTHIEINEVADEPLKPTLKIS